MSIFNFFLEQVKQIKARVMPVSSGMRFEVGEGLTEEEEEKAREVIKKKPVETERKSVFDYFVEAGRALPPTKTPVEAIQRMAVEPAREFVRQVPRIGEFVGEGTTGLLFGDVREKGIAGIPEHIWEVERSIIEIAPKFGFSTYQAFRHPGKVEKKPYTVPSSKITEELGFKKEYPTYQKEFDKTANEIIEGKKPLWHALIPFAEVPFDGMIVSSFLTSGAKSIFKKVKVNSNETASAIKAMGLKDISVKAQKTQFRKLAHEVHPDKMGVQGEKLMTELNNANDILNKARSQGLLVKEPSKIALAMKGIAETGLRKPSEIGKAFVRKETPYLGVKGLLPEQAGTIPTRPFQPVKKPAFGLSVRDIKAKPIAKPTLPAEAVKKVKPTTEKIISSLGKAKRTDPACVKTFRETIKKHPDAIPERVIFSDTIENASEQYLSNIKRGTSKQLEGFTHLRANVDGKIIESKPFVPKGAKAFKEDEILKSISTGPQKVRKEIKLPPVKESKDLSYKEIKLLTSPDIAGKGFVMKGLPKRKGLSARMRVRRELEKLKKDRLKLSIETIAQIKKMSSVPVGKVKSTINKIIKIKKSDELKKLNEYYAEEARIALENKSLADFKRAAAISKEIEIKMKAKMEPLEYVMELKYRKDIAKTELGVDEIDIIKKEYPTEFAIGKMEKEQKMIEALSEGFFDELSKMKLSDADLKTVFDFRETGQSFKLKDFSVEQIDKIKKINGEITKITSYIDDKLEGFGLLDERLDEETYIRAYLRNLDGSPASLDKITQLRIDQGSNFRELMSSASQKIKKSTIKETRKYDTADARDAVLKKYGLKTDRDLLRVMTNYISSMDGMIGNHTLSNTLRAIARSGKKADRIKEIYNPKDLTKFRIGLSKELKKTREYLLDLAKENRVLTDDQIKIIQKSKKPLLKTESDDILEELGTGTKDIKEFFDEIIENVKGVKKETTEMLKEKTRTAKEKALTNLRNQYETIAKEKAKLEEQGFKDLGVRGAEPLRGVMGQKLERDFIEEIVKVRSTTSVGANLDQISQTGKLMMAVGDLFSIPRTWWLRVQETGMIKGTRAFWDDAMGITFKKRTPERISESAEFIRTDRQTIGDVDTLKKFKGEIDRELSSFEKFIDKADTLTDIKGIQQAKEGVVNAFQGLENWQFKKLMTSAKDDLWRIKVKQLTGKGIPLREAQLEAGRSIDILSGVSNFKKIMAKHPKAFSQSIQRGLRISLFAPNLFVTMGRMLKNYGIDIFAKGARGSMARQATVRMVIWSQVILQSLSFALNGHSSFENEDKKKILALKVPGMLDEKGNQYYLNPLGWIAKPFDLVMRPTESVMNKIALLPRFAMNLFLSPYKYEDPSKSRIGGALSGVVPLPFTLQGLLNYGISKFQEDEQYGVAENAQQQMMLSALEFFGFEGVYTSGRAKTTVATDVMKQTKEVFDDPENFKNLPIYIENWLLSKDLPSPPKTEYEKAISEEKEKDKEIREKFRPKFDEIQKVKETDQSKADEMVERLSDEEWEIYKELRGTTKTKTTNKLKEEFYPTFLRIQEVKEKNQEEADKIVNDLSEEEWRIYGLLKAQLE